MLERSHARLERREAAHVEGEPMAHDDARPHVNNLDGTAVEASVEQLTAEHVAPDAKVVDGIGRSSTGEMGRPRRHAGNHGVVSDAEKHDEAQSGGRHVSAPPTRGVRDGEHAGGPNTRILKTWCR